MLIHVIKGYYINVLFFGTSMDAIWLRVDDMGWSTISNISFMIIGGLLDGTKGFENRIRRVYVNRILVFYFFFFFSNEFKYDGAAQFHQPPQTYLSTTSYGDI